MLLSFNFPQGKPLSVELMGRIDCYRCWNKASRDKSGSSFNLNSDEKFLYNARDVNKGAKVQPEEVKEFLV